MAQLVEFDNPWSLSDPLAAVQTGTLILTFWRNGTEQQRQFALLNDRLLHDLASPRVYYHTIEGLMELL